MSETDRAGAEMPPSSNGSSTSSSNGTKRKRDDDKSTMDSSLGIGRTLAALPTPDLPVFNLITKPKSAAAVIGSAPTSTRLKNNENEAEWTTVTAPPKKKAKKIPKKESDNYPAITFSPDCKLQSQIKISDLQNLVLYILADGTGPNWVSVRHRPQIRKVVVLMVPGLEKEMFFPPTDEDIEKKVEEARRETADGRYVSPDDYYPKKLVKDNLPDGLKEWADMFEHLWPVKTPGDDKYSKMHSPLHAMLSAPIPKSQDEKDSKKKGPKQVKENGFKKQRTRITEYLASPEEQLENDYILHPAVYDDEKDKEYLRQSRIKAGATAEQGWVDTRVETWESGSPPESEIEAGSLTAGRDILAMDCEMCMTGEHEFSLTRISLVSWDGSVVLDELVKPDKPITNYVTQFSGITEEMLRNVTTTLSDIQARLLSLLTPRTILLGHSLNSDLTALKLTHPFIIDTSLIYPHPRGPPLKSSLKYLAQKYLGKEIQKGGGQMSGAGAGHDSIEDARTCLDLVKQKCERGPGWGTGEAQNENLFKRLARAGVRYKAQGGSAAGESGTGGRSSAAVDWGDPRKGAGAAASHSFGCQSDEDVVRQVVRAVKGDPDGQDVPGGGVDFVWARMRELEALKGWWNKNRELAPPARTLAVLPDPAIADEEGVPEADVIPDPALADPSAATKLSEAAAAAEKAEADLASAARALTSRVKAIYDSLPPCTAFIVYSGSGDPREMSRLQQVQQTFKREFKVKKWDQLSVKWTDVEEQELKRAARRARNGVGFVCVK
jgi:RNA exonuclease 1